MHSAWCKDRLQTIEYVKHKLKYEIVLPGLEFILLQYSLLFDKSGYSMDSF